MNTEIQQNVTWSSFEYTATTTSGNLEEKWEDIEREFSETFKEYSTEVVRWFKSKTIPK